MPDSDNSIRRSGQGVPVVAPAPGTTRAIARAVIALPAVFLALAPQSPGVFADNPPPSGKEFVVRNSSIDAGSGRGDGGTFAVTGTIGQPDAGVVTGGTFTLRGGFWTFRTESDRVFRNGFE